MAFEFINEDKIKTILAKIKIVLADYEIRHLTMTIGDLLESEDKLSLYLCTLGEVMAECNYTHATAYLNRRIVRAEKWRKRALLGDKVTFIEKTLDDQVVKEFEAEIETAYTAESAMNLCAGCKKVLDSMAKRITQLRDEAKRAKF